MTIPDPLVYASIVPLLGATAKVGQWFVQDVIRQKKTNDRSNAAIDQRPARAEMTISEFRPIADLLKDELNGRYMMAQEARDKFAAIDAKLVEVDRKMDHQYNGLKMFVQAALDNVKLNVGK